MKNELFFYYFDSFSTLAKSLSVRSNLLYQEVFAIAKSPPSSLM